MKFLKAKETPQEEAGPESLEGVRPLRVASSWEGTAAERGCGVPHYARNWAGSHGGQPGADLRQLATRASEKTCSRV